MEGDPQSVAQLFGHLVKTPGQVSSPAYDCKKPVGLSSSFAKERIKNPKPARANFTAAFTALLARQQWPKEHLPMESGLVIADTCDSVAADYDCAPIRLEIPLMGFSHLYKFCAALKKVGWPTDSNAGIELDTHADS